MFPSLPIEPEVRGQRPEVGEQSEEKVFPTPDRYPLTTFFLDERKIKLFLVHRWVATVDIYWPEILLNLIQDISFGAA